MINNNFCKSLQNSTALQNNIALQSNETQHESSNRNVDPITILRRSLQKPIAFNPVFAQVSGSATAGLFLSQLWYWSDKGHDPDGWIYKTYQEWWKETYLGRHELDSARRKLKKIGILEEKKEGIPCRLYYRINESRLIEEIGKLNCQNRQSSLPDSSSQFDESDNSVCQIRQTELTDPSNIQYTETTSENTNKDHSHSHTRAHTRVEHQEREREENENNLKINKNTNGGGSNVEPDPDISSSTALTNSNPDRKRQIFREPNCDFNHISSGTFEQFKEDLFEFTKRNSNSSPMGLYKAILNDVINSRGNHPYWKDWLADKPIGSSEMNPWETQPGVIDQDFLKYLQDEFWDSNKSPSQNLDEAYKIANNPQRARPHWENYQLRKQRQEEEQQQAQTVETSDPENPYPDEDPFRSVENALNDENFLKRFQDPQFGHILSNPIRKALNHANEEEENLIWQMLFNCPVTKGWAEQEYNKCKKADNNTSEHKQSKVNTNTGFSTLGDVLPSMA